MKLTVKFCRCGANISENEMASAFSVCREKYRKLEKNPSLITTTQRQTLSELTGIALTNIIFK